MTNPEKREAPVTAPDLMTEEEATHELQLSADDVRRLIERGILAGRQTRNGMRLNRADVEAYHTHRRDSPDAAERTA